MLDRDNPKPLYLQLEDIMRTAIASGNWQRGHAIPSENELCKEYGLSRMTVRSVITTLVKDGLLYRVQGKGTFVASPKISATSPAYVGVREQLEMQGYTISTRLISAEILEAGSKVRLQLGLKKDDQVIRLRRARFADGIPVSIHESFLPVKLCPEFDISMIGQEQLCTVLKNEYNLSAATVHETLESVLASPEEAELLGVKEGHPLLLLCETNTDSLGTTFEYSQIIFRGDKIRLEFDYHI